MLLKCPVSYALKTHCPYILSILIQGVSFQTLCSICCFFQWVKTWIIETYCAAVNTEAISLLHIVNHMLREPTLLSVCALDCWCCSNAVVIWCLFLGSLIHAAWISPMVQSRLRHVFPREPVAALFGLTLRVNKLVTKFCWTNCEVGGPGKQNKVRSWLTFALKSFCNDDSYFQHGMFCSDSV